MKRATGKLRAHRSLALAARRAAGAFCRRHLKPNPPCRAPLWTLALLRWARKRGGGARASASPRYTASTVAWTSHFQLHFAFAAPFRVASASRRVQAQAAVEARNEPTKVRRRLADGFGTRLPAAMRYATGVDRVDRSASAVHPSLGSPGRMHPIVQGQLARSIGAAQSTRLFARARTRSPSLSRASPEQSLRQVTRAFSLNRVLEPARDTAQIRRPIRRIWRASTSGTTVVHASPRLQALAMQRAVDLVWRSNTTAAETVDNLPRSATTSASAASLARSTSAAAPTPPGRNVDKTIVGASALDPVLVDRLADDVIRRIDRRARIERERWGQ